MVPTRSAAKDERAFDMIARYTEQLEIRRGKVIMHSLGVL
jgi:hypothetical protein